MFSQFRWCFKLTPTIDDLFTFPTDSAAAKHVVLIESGVHSYGTGTLVQVGKRRLVLTCSHVVTQNKKNYCTWRGKRFPIRLIYKNPIFDRPFDVAVFEAPRDIPKAAFCRAMRSNPIVGEYRAEVIDIVCHWDSLIDCSSPRIICEVHWISCV